VDRVDEAEQLVRGVSAPQHRLREHDPQRGMRVLPAVLAHAGNVPFDVTGIRLGFVERRRQEQDELTLAVDEVRLDRRHRLLRARRIAEAGDDRPALRDRVDAALDALRRTERRPVVKVRAGDTMLRPTPLPRRPLSRAACAL
jgi:hypothetical protein